MEARPVYALVQDAANFDSSRIRYAINEEMTRAAHSTSWAIDAIATVKEMVGPGSGDDFFPCETAGTLGVIGDVNNGLHKQRFVSKSSSFAKPPVCPSKD